MDRTLRESARGYLGGARDAKESLRGKMSTSLLPLLFASCPSPPPRPRAVLLAYTWGSGPSSCSPYFIRSWVALPPSERANTDLRILWEGSVAPCAGEPVGADAQFIKMPDDVLKTLKATKLNPAAYRMRAFTWWLALPEGKARNYGYVGVLDTDMIFQSDLFDALHAYTTEHGIQQEEVLHLVSENPAERNGLYTARRLHLDSRCDVPLTDFLMNNRIVSKTPTAGAGGRRLRGAAKAPVYTPLYNTTAFWGRLATFIDSPWSWFGMRGRVRYASRSSTCLSVRWPSAGIKACSTYWSGRICSRSALEARRQRFMCGIALKGLLRRWTSVG